MVGFLWVVTVTAYLFAAIAFLIGMYAGGTDIQLILAGIYFTCGTIALTAIGVIHELERIKKRLPGKD